jgi:hypothetical protein
VATVDSAGRLNRAKGRPWVTLDRVWSARRATAVVGRRCRSTLPVGRSRGESEWRTATAAKRKEHRRKKQSMPSDLYCTILYSEAGQRQQCTHCTQMQNQILAWHGRDGKGKKGFQGKETVGFVPLGLRCKMPPAQPDLYFPCSLQGKSGRFRLFPPSFSSTVRMGKGRKGSKGKKPWFRSLGAAV